MDENPTPARLEALRTAMKQAALDVVALNPGPSFTHLTGVSFHLMERPVVLIVPSDGEPALVLPEFEATKAARIGFPVREFRYSENPSEWEAAFRTAAVSLGIDGKKIGVEPRQLRLLEFRFVRGAAPEADFPDASEALASLRLRKDDVEIAAMRKAVQVAQTALEAVLPAIRVGATERDIASALTMELLRNGSDPELPFAPIVCAGPNSANPHATPSQRKIAGGDLLLVDWGATVEGKNSD